MIQQLGKDGKKNSIDYSWKKVSTTKICNIFSIAYYVLTIRTKTQLFKLKRFVF